jgi:hypothetical protein
MAEAHDLQATDPAASMRRWTHVDRTLVRNAAVVPLFTTPDVAITTNRVCEYEVHPSLGPLLAQTSLKCGAQSGDSESTSPSP